MHLHVKKCGAAAEGQGEDEKEKENEIAKELEKLDADVKNASADPDAQMKINAKVDEKLYDLLLHQYKVPSVKIP